MPINPTWPAVAEDWAPYWNCAGGDSPLDRYVEVTPRTRGRTSVQRGRQYELDQIRSGEYQVTLANTDGALDPLNSSGPWAGHIMAYQPYRKRAQWPPTANLLTQVQATGGDLGGCSTGPLDISGSGQDIFSLTDPSGGGQIVADATAWQGSRVLAFQVPNGRRRRPGRDRLRHLHGAGRRLATGEERDRQHLGEHGANLGVMGQRRRDSPVAVSNTINVAVETICGRPTEEPLARSMAEADSEKRTFPKIGSVPCLSSGSSSSSSGF
ncbi:hypothetical protein ACPCTO_35155 [Streptomyces olivoreticuli]